MLRFAFQHVRHTGAADALLARRRNMDSAIGQSSYYRLVCSDTNSLTRACDRDVEFDIAVGFPALNAEMFLMHTVFAPAFLQCGVGDRIHECLAAAYV